jgi:hypothetical protein
MRSSSNKSLPTNRRPRFGFGRWLCGSFRRWTRRHRPFPAWAGDECLLAKHEPATVYKTQVWLIMWIR